MSVEMLTTRKCNICGKNISDEIYYSCKEQYATKNDWCRVYTGTQITTDGIPSYNKTHTDVCSSCWDKLADRGKST